MLTDGRTHIPALAGGFPRGITMKLAIKRAAFLAAVALCLLPAADAYAQSGEAVPGFAGSLLASPDGVSAKAADKQATNAGLIIYDNSTAPVLFAFSSTDLAARWGDELFTTSAGILSSHKIAVFNSGSSLGPLLTANIGVDFFDAITAAPLGGYTTTVNFGAGLNPGFFSTITITPLDPLNIFLNTTDIIVIQRVISRTGTASRLGIVLPGPPTVGSSPATMYIQASTVGGGVAGFYTIASGPANPLHQIGVNPPPVGARNSTWGQLKQLYR